MTLLKEIAAELIGMFFGDARLTLAILLIVAVSGALIEFTAIDPVIGGGGPIPFTRRERIADRRIGGD